MSTAAPPLTSYKRHFSRFLAAAPDRLHFAAHSHHAWPDVTFDAQERAWRDAAELADRKWEKVFGEVLPAAQRHVARQLALPDPDTVTFAPSTHDLVTRVLSCFEAPTPLRILTTDSEFHSFRRQAQRLEEAGRARVERVLLEPFETFPARLGEAIGRGGHHLVYVSHVFFDSGYVLEDLLAMVEAVPRRDTFVIVDGYHAFMARPVDLSAIHARVFFLAGGYKYAMAGEGACFLHAPPGYGERPVVTGWFAGFADLEAGVRRVSYPRGGGRFLGATFDPSGVYRFNAVQDWLAREGLGVADIHKRVRALQKIFLDELGRVPGGALSGAQLVPPPAIRARGNFLTFRLPGAAELQRRLLARNVVVDVRGDRLRIGFGIYHDREDVEALVRRLAG
jgi:selenocysteine lyase/cysteine desulfurase